MVFQAVLFLLFGFRVASILPFDRLPLTPIHTGLPAVLAQADLAPSDVVPSSPARIFKNSKNKKQEQVQTLTGTVEWRYDPLAWDCDVPNCDHFSLYDDASHSNFDIDDARAALPYEGKRVTLTGVVDEKKKSIRLISIEPEK
jgi:hypothetical protein